MKIKVKIKRKEKIKTLVVSPHTIVVVKSEYPDVDAAKALAALFNKRGIVVASVIAVGQESDVLSWSPADQEVLLSALVEARVKREIGQG